MALAGRYRSPVEVLDKRTESTQTFAQPDGSFRFVQTASPQRVRQGSAWVPANPTLKLTDGKVVPQASVLGVRFSGGGSGPMVEIVKGARNLALSWPGQLPIPTLNGDTATYSEVLPGVDLRLSAGVDSFSQVLVVKTAEAAKNPALAQLPFGLATQGVSVEQDADSGFLRAVDPAGESVFVSDGARMWDSPESVASTPAAASKRTTAEVDVGVSADPATEPLPTRIENVPVQLTSKNLTLAPSVPMLTHPDTNFPVYIDPGFNGGTEIWTPVSRKNPSTSYWSSDGYRDYMRVGQLYQGATNDDWRTLVQFNITKLKGTQIRSAGVHVNVWHSANCVASPMQLWRTNAISKSSAVTWNNTKDKYWKRLAERKATANKSACPKGNDEINFNQVAVKEAFQSAATAKYSSITFAYRGKSESDGLQWKKLVAGSSYLDIVFNHIPGKPTGQSLTPCDEACASPAVTSTKKPTLTMKATDADEGKLRYEFRVANSTKTEILSSKESVTGVKSAASRPWTVTKSLADGQYYWRGRACDTYKCGPYTGWFNFKVDSTNPKLPKVESTDYPTTGWNGGPGEAGKFTFSAGSTADGVTEFRYALNGGKATLVIPDSKGKATVSLKPKDMKNTLTLSALDLAGNRSGTIPYGFKVKPEGDSWYWSLDEGKGTTAASEPLNDRPLTMSGTGNTWSDMAMADSEGSAHFTGTGEMATSLPVVNTTAVAGLTVAAWVRLPAPPAEDSPDDETEVPDPGEDAEDPGTDGDDPDSEESPPDVEDDTPVALPPTRNQSAVSADGTKHSMFRLGYRNDLNVDQDTAGTADPAWCFSLAAADTATAAETTACSTADVTPGDWVHLVGVIDPINNQVRLYVNGTPAIDGTVTPVAGKALWEATGKFAIARALSGSAAAERWVGDIDEVYVVPRVWTTGEIDFKAFVPDE